MRQLFNYYRKESQSLWLILFAFFCGLALFFWSQFGKDPIVIKAFPNIMFLLLIVFVVVTGIRELKRIIDSYRSKHLRLLPITESVLYFSNLLFSWGTIVIQIIVYAEIMHLLLYQYQQSSWDNYYLAIAGGSYYLFGFLVYFQLIYLLSRTIVNYCPVKFQKILMPILLLLFFVLENVISWWSVQAIRGLNILGEFKISILGESSAFYWSDFIIDIIFIIMYKL